MQIIDAQSSNKKIIRNIIYKNGNSQTDVKSVIYKKKFDDVDWPSAKGKTFIKERPDTCDCAQYYQVKVEPRFSGIYLGKTFDCKNIPEIIYIESTRQISASRHIDWGSNFAGEEIIYDLITFEKDKRIDSAILKILKPVGLEKLLLDGTVIIEAAAVENAQASIIEGKPYIFYNPEIIEKIMSDDWEVIGVFGHELAHIIEFHNIKTKNANNSVKKIYRENELDADEYAGFIMGYLNADKNEVLRMLKIVKYNEEGLTLPNKKDRAERILAGWERAITNIKDITINKKYIFYETKAEDLYKQGNFYTAILYLDTAILYNAHSDKLFERRAMAQQSLNKDINLVFSDANKAIELNEKNVVALGLRAWINIQMNKIGEAENDVNKLIKIDSVNRNIFFLKAEINKSKREFDKAIKNYCLAAQIDSTYLLVFQQRGLLYDFLNNDELALNDYEYCIRHSPKFGYGYRLKAGLFYKQMKYDLAIPCLDIAIELDSTNWDYLYLRGWCFFSKGTQFGKLDFDYLNMSLNDFNCVLKYYSKELNSLSYIARIYNLFNNLDSSLVYYDRLVNLNPIPLNYYERAFVNYRLERFEYSFNDFNEVIKINPKDYNSFEGRAFSNMMLGKYNQAITDFNIIIKNQPNFKNSFLGKAYSQYLQKDFSAALFSFVILNTTNFTLDTTNYFYSFLNYKSNSRALLNYLIGGCYYNLEKYSDAIISYNFALKNDPNYADAYFYLGQTYFQINKKKMAYKYFKKAKSLGYNENKIDDFIDLLNK